MTRPPTRTPEQARQLAALDDLEELGDDAIISQESEAHALKPRANVSDESRSVVITDHLLRGDRQLQSPSFPRSTGEATLVIRDRRALDELRKGMVRRQVQDKPGNHALYLWGALGLVAFVLGGIVALLATDSGSAAPATADSALPRSSAATQTAAPSLHAAAPARTATDALHSVRLDDLPVEPPRAR